MNRAKLRLAGWVFLALASRAGAQDVYRGGTVERDLDNGKAFSYRVLLEKGQFLQATAVQLSGDVLLRLYNPARQPVAQINRVALGGSEELLWVAGEAGEFHLEAAAVGGPARYRFQAVMRVPSDLDSLRASTFALVLEANRLHENRATQPQARVKYREAAELWKASSDAYWQAWCLNREGILHLVTGMARDARDTMERAVAILRTLPQERNTLAAALGNLATAYLNAGEYGRSATVFEEALGTMRNDLDSGTLRSILNNASIVYRQLGEFARAEEALRHVIALERELQGAGVLSHALTNMAQLLLSLGDSQGALRFWQMVIKEAPPTEPHSLQGGLGMTYLILGDYVMSAHYWEKAVESARAAQHDGNLVTALTGIGAVKLRQGDRTGSIRALDDALEVARRHPAQVSLLVSPLKVMCLARMENGQPKEAREAAGQALAIIRQRNQKIALSTALSCAADAELALGRPAESRKLYAEALTTSEEMPPSREVALVGLARLERESGRPREALALVQEAITLKERRAASISEVSTRAYARATSAATYRMASEIWMELHAADPSAGYAMKSLEVVERARARTLVESISGEGRMTLISRELARQEERLLAAVNKAQREALAEGLTTAQRAKAHAALLDAEQQLNLFQNTIRAEFPQPDVLDVRGMQKSLPGGAETALLYYSVGPETRYLWAVTSGELVSARLPGKAAIDAKVRAFRELLSRPPVALSASRGRQELAAAAAELYRLLIAPVEKAIAGKARLVVVPDEALHALPFEALPAVMDRYRVSYSPSISVMASLAARQQWKGPRTLLAFADPARTGAASVERGFPQTALPYTRKEVEAIARALGDATVREGVQASEQAFKTANPVDYRYLHFAVHGYLDREMPMRSGLVLASAAGDGEDGLLQASEIARLRLRADVVTLSACETGLGQILDAEGVLGLSRAFLHAGARGVVVSLWNVNDAASAELMRVFYGHLKKGVAGPEALRRAKLTMARQTGNWSHPYYWAPFVYIGL